MMPRPSFMPVADLDALLAQLLDPSTASIRHAEGAMRKALLQPAFVCDLFERLHGSASPQIRQLAAVLVRRRIASLWTKLEPPIQRQLQTALLQLMPAEPERPVWRSMASVACVVAKYALPRGEWPELFPYLSESSRSPKPSHRELSMVLLSALLEDPEVVDSSLRPHFSMLAGTLTALLADADHPHVRRAALKAVGGWASVLLDDDVKALKPLLPPCEQPSPDVLAPRVHAPPA
jgi:hypothetical protein